MMHYASGVGIGVNVGIEENRKMLANLEDMKLVARGRQQSQEENRKQDQQESQENWWCQKEYRKRQKKEFFAWTHIF